MAKRLSPMDIAFLQFESQNSPAHVASLQIFELPKSYKNGKGNFYHDLLDAFADYTTVEEPFNLKLNSPKVFSDRQLPVWVKDDAFEIDYHIRYAGLPRPGRMDQLLKLVERLHGRLLDRTRPLWEIYFIEGLEGDRFALYCKVHHAVVDGVGGMKMMDRALSSSADELPRLAPWQHKEPPSRQKPPADANDAMSSLAQTVAEQLNALPELGKLLGDLVRQPLGLSDRQGSLPFTAPRTLFNRPVGQHRRFVTQTIDLNRIKAIGQARDATVNDVVLAVCSGALRRYLTRRKKLPTDALLTSIPVSIRRDDDGARGNQIAMILANLATNVPNPVERLEAIKASTADAKNELRALSRTTANNFTMVMNGLVLGAQALGLDERLSPAANLVISNVPGPKEDRYLMGARLVANYPVSVLVDGLALNITLLGYKDQLDFGYIACRDAMPDIDDLVDDMSASLEELEQALLTPVIDEPAAEEEAVEAAE